MTVKQLIKYLKKIPQSTEIAVFDTYEDVNDSPIEKIYASIAIGYSQEYDKVIIMPDRA